MTRPVRVCFWSTSFQSDNQALACYLADQPGWDVVVAMDRPEDYQREPVHRLMPFAGRFVDRQARSARREIEAFEADLVIVDNHVPSYRVAPRVFVLWHGFGWRYDDLARMRKDLRKHVGDVTGENESFRWQAFGEWDRRYRIEHSGFAPGNVVALGSAYSDLLLPGNELSAAFDRTAVQSRYSINLDDKTVLMALTWHHGGALSHWGDEEELLGRFFEHVHGLGANVLVRMHDRHRYEEQFVAKLESIVRRHPRVQLEFKSEHPDSLVDLLVSDVFVSNYSSLLNACYYTRKPTVHVDPHDASQADGVFLTMRRGQVRRTRTDAVAGHWKLPPGETGGLRARSFEDLLEGVSRGLEQPSCCEDAARAFCDRYITDANGGTRERIASFVRRWLGG